jgi:mannobiose 2-epimerase
MQNPLLIYKTELQIELNAILNYWISHAPDEMYGGFYGRIDEKNRVYPQSPKGLVLNCRILWTFSAAYMKNENPEYLEMAHRAYQYLVGHYWDEHFGGVYWSVDYKGEPDNSRKQIYGQAFFIYALSEYYRATKSGNALEKVRQVYELIEIHAYDRRQKGYFEAFDREWSPLEDLRLSEKDANEKKTMNTHLHIVEAYMNLYRIWHDTGLRHKIESLLEVFAHHFVNDRTHHLNLFFDDDWNLKSGLISYGHDIEAAWLLQEAAKTIRHPGWMLTMQALAVKIADAAIEGLEPDGGLKYESENGHFVSEKHWWPQAEAMVGFFNAYQVSGKELYLQRSLQSWEFTKEYIIDNENGEWFWGVNADNTPMAGRDKAGFWKCPYHNARACLEIISRINGITGENN